MRSLQIVQVGLMDANGFLQLLDVLGATLAKGSLGLSVALFAFFRCRIDLARDKRVLAWTQW